MWDQKTGTHPSNVPECGTFTVHQQLSKNEKLDVLQIKQALQTHFVKDKYELRAEYGQLSAPWRLC